MIIYYASNAYLFNENQLGLKLCQKNYSFVANTNLFKGAMKRLEALFIEKRYNLGIDIDEKSLQHAVECL